MESRRHHGIAIRTFRRKAARRSENSLVSTLSVLRALGVECSVDTSAETPLLNVRGVGLDGLREAAAVLTPLWGWRSVLVLGGVLLSWKWTSDQIFLAGIIPAACAALAIVASYWLPDRSNAFET